MSIFSQDEKNRLSKEHLYQTEIRKSKERTEAEALQRAKTAFTNTVPLFLDVVQEIPDVFESASVKPTLYKLGAGIFAKSKYMYNLSVEDNGILCVDKNGKLFSLIYTYKGTGHKTVWYYEKRFYAPEACFAIFNKKKYYSSNFNYVSFNPDDNQIHLAVQLSYRDNVSYLGLLAHTIYGVEIGRHWDGDHIVDHCSFNPNEELSREEKIELLKKWVFDKISNIAR